MSSYELHTYSCYPQHEREHAMTTEQKNIPIVTKEMRDRPYSKAAERLLIEQETEKFLSNGGSITYVKDGKSYD